MIFSWGCMIVYNISACFLGRVIKLDRFFQLYYYTTLCVSCPIVSIAPTLAVDLTANTTRLPNVAPYNTFSLTCTAISRVGERSVALPKRFLWLRRHGPSELNLDPLSNSATIQIQNGDNLNQATSSSMLTVTEDIPRDYRYRCRVDLNLTADMILNRADVYPITVTGKTQLYVDSFQIMSLSICLSRDHLVVLPYSLEITPPLFAG